MRSKKNFVSLVAALSSLSAWAIPSGGEFDYASYKKVHGRLLFDGDSGSKSFLEDLKKEQGWKGELKAATKLLRRSMFDIADCGKTREKFERRFGAVFSVCEREIWGRAELISPGNRAATLLHAATLKAAINAVEDTGYALGDEERVYSTVREYPMGDYPDREGRLPRPLLSPPPGECVAHVWHGEARGGCPRNGLATDVAAGVISAVSLGVVEPQDIHFGCVKTKDLRVVTRDSRGILRLYEGELDVPFEEGESEAAVGARLKAREQELWRVLGARWCRGA